MSENYKEIWNFNKIIILVLNYKMKYIKLNVFIEKASENKNLKTLI